MLWCWASLFFVVQASGQECGTIPTPEQIEHLTQTRLARQSYDAMSLTQNRSGNTLKWIPVQFHECLLNSSTWPVLYNELIEEWMHDLNSRFAPYGIQFYQCGEVDFFNSSTLWSFDSSEEPLLAPYEVPNVLNIYMFAAVTIGGGQVAGYSYLPPSADRVILSRSAIYSNKIFLHEVGHYFGLYHTHGKTGAASDEWVNGNNCLTAGDDVCDTPADPNLNGRVSNCAYIGGPNDPYGQPYIPQVANIMSYAPEACCDVFTVGQMNRMAYTATYDRSYLSGCAHPSGCDNPIKDLPVVFDFETDLQGWSSTGYSGWSNFADWQQINGPTPTPNTGPDQAHSGTGYAYMDASIYAQQGGTGGAFISPCIDLRGVESPKLTFHYHAYGTDNEIIAMQGSLDGGASWIGIDSASMLFYRSYNQGNQWNRVNVDLAAFKNAPALQLRIYAWSWNAQGDYALDSIAVYNDPSSTCSINHVFEKYHVSCYGANDGQLNVNASGVFTGPLSYLWSNGHTGTNPTNLGPGLYTVTITAQNGCSAVASTSLLSPNKLYVNSTQSNVTTIGGSNGSATAIAMGGKAPFSYLWSNGATSATINGLTTGVYTVTVTDLNQCSATRILTILQPTTNCSSFQSTFPWASGLNSTNLGIFMQVGAPQDQLNWTRQSGPTPTANTGPDAAYESTHYWYVRASGSNSPNKTAILKTNPCLRLNQLVNPVFEFYYHMYGNQMGSLRVEVSVDGEATWTPIWSIIGNQGNQWYKASISLLPYRSDQTKIRIVATTGVGATSDIAIDAVYIGNGGLNTYYETPENTFEQAPILSVFPNPSSGMFTLRMEEGIQCEQAEVLNLAGQVIWQEQTATSLLSIDLSEQPQGLYFLRVRHGDTVEVLRLLRQ